MRVNKYKISKKRRLRRRGKYSKKLKTKSRKSGGRVLSFIRGYHKNQVKIGAICKIPEFFFESYTYFFDIIGIQPVKPIPYPNTGINISIHGELIRKTETAGVYTLSVKLDSAATIDDVYFVRENMQDILLDIKYIEDNEKKLTLYVDDSTKTETIVVTKNGPYSNPGYSPTEPKKVFVCNDTDNHILKLLLRLWKRKYDRNPKDPGFKTFDVFFEEFSTRYPQIVKLFREYEYNFEVVEIQLSSSS